MTMTTDMDTEQLVPPNVKDQLRDALEKAHAFIAEETGIPPPLLSLTLTFSDSTTSAVWWHATYKHPEWEWDIAVRESSSDLAKLCKLMTKKIARSELLHRINTENE